MDNPIYIIPHWTYGMFTKQGIGRKCIFTATFITFVVMKKKFVKCMDMFLQNVYVFSKFISFKILEHCIT